MLDILANKEINSNDSDDEEDIKVPEIKSSITYSSAFDKLDSLKEFALTNGFTNILTNLMNIQETLIDNQCNIIKKQSMITDYFK